MNVPPTPLPDIASLRAQVDAIDTALAALIAQRTGLARSIAAAKAAEGGTHGFGWRPARESQVLRAVLHGQPDLDPLLVSTVWRALMASNLAAQGGLETVAVAQSAAAARLTFGGAANEMVLDSAEDCLAAARDGARTIAVLPWPAPAQDWWLLLASREDFAPLHVCAATARRGARDDAPEALMLASRAPEAAGGDVSLLAMPDGGAAPGDHLASAGEWRLFRVPGFVAAEEARASGWRLVGSYTF